MELYYATILVLIVTNEQIILAADSRTTHLSPDGVSRTGTIDKICRVNGYYYAVSGLNTGGNGSFSLPRLLQSLLLRHADLGAAVRQLADTLAPAIRDYLQKLKESSPATFRQLQHYCSAGGEIFIVGKVAGQPTAYLIDYQVTEDPSVRVEMHTGRIDIRSITGAGDCFWRAIGNVSFLGSRMPTIQEMAADPVGKAGWIIREGIRRSPEFVGGPVKILQVTEEGEAWLEEERP